MLGWLFKKKKTVTNVKQETVVLGNKNRVTQTTVAVNQKYSKANGDIVGGNKYSTYTPAYDPLMDPSNPINPLSPLNPMNQPGYDSPKYSHTHSHDSGSSSSSHSHSHYHSYDSGSSYHSHDHSSSSSYDSGSSYDSSSSYTSSSD